MIVTARVRRSALPPPLLRHDGAGWVLHAAYTYTDWRRGADVPVPAGFSFDLASIPRLLWPLVAPFELSIVAPLVHDYLYRRGGVVPGRRYTRAEADRLFLEIMEIEGVPRWRRRLAYPAVRVAGRSAWRAAPLAMEAAA